MLDVEASDVSGCGVALRVYEPPAAAAAAAAPLTVLYAHGGGWALSSVRTHDELCRRLCVAAGVTVVSVDYRLAPEAPFPAPLDDMHAAFAWAAARAPGGRVVVAGDSAGGHLAAALALRLRDEARAGAPSAQQPVGQVLIYPAVDARCDTESYARFSDGFQLTREKMLWFWGLLLGSDDSAAQDAQRYASPLRAGDLSGLPPALVVLADADVLHDEGASFAAALGAEVAEFKGVLHGFVNDAENEAAAEAIARVAQWLRALLPAA